MYDAPFVDVFHNLMVEKDPITLLLNLILFNNAVNMRPFGKKEDWECHVFLLDGIWQRLRREM